LTGATGLVIVVWLIALGLLLVQPDSPDEEAPTQFVLPDPSPRFQRISSESEANVAADVTPLAAGTPLPAEPPTRIEAPREPVPNQIIVQFKPESTEAQRTQYIEKLGGTVSQQIGALHAAVVSVSVPAVTLPPVDLSVVIATEPDYYVVALDDAAPDDPYFAQQWGLPVIGAPTAWGEPPPQPASVTVA
jgi:hypothetical protein